MAKQTVKARMHYGTNSLDLTIPSKIVQENNIKEGDIFTIDTEKDKENQIVIKYIRVFKQ
ncbi:MAG: AbrB/MazE/SpoVT family DNA-binding domain-containing protein [Candidatus Odinarchaeota archaeon]